MQNVTYSLITINAEPNGNWQIWGHRKQGDFRLMRPAPATLELAISIASLYSTPILFANHDSIATQRYLAVIEQIDTLTQEVKDLEGRYGAEQQWSRQLKAALDADPIKQAETVAENLGHENDALRHDVAELQRALDGGLLADMQELRLMVDQVDTYAGYYYATTKDGEAALPFAEWYENLCQESDDEYA